MYRLPSEEKQHKETIGALILSIMILSFNLFGDGLRDALDPRLKK